MAFEEGQLRDGGVAALHQLGEFGRSEEAEFAGGLARVEEQTEIGGRDAGRFKEAVFLDIVGDEVVVAGTAEFVEEAPDAQCVLAEEEVVFATELLARFARRLVEPCGDVALEAPEDEDGGSGNQREKILYADDDGKEHGDDGRECEVAIDSGGAALGGFGLGGGLPFEEALAGDEAADHGADDGVDGHHGLVREKGEGEQSGEERLLEACEDVSGAALLLAEEGTTDAEEELDKDGNEEQEEGDEGPVNRTAGKAEPSGDQQDHGRGLDEGAAQIVENLPAGDGRDGVADELAGLVGNAAEEPLGDLPVAADPAVFAARVGAVVRGVIVDDLDVGGEAGAGVGALDEVVAEEGVAGEALFEHSVEGGDFVDAFAGEAALGVEVLVDVGDGAGVDIEAGLAGVDIGHARLRGGMDADADAGLQDAVALGDDAAFGIDDGAVEGVHHGADEGVGGAAGELGIGVERDDIAHAAQDAGVAGLHGESVEKAHQ